MSVQTYNPIELRYAIGDLATHRFVTEEDYERRAKFSRKLSAKLMSQVLKNRTLEEENEILRAERSHWHHMYNNNLDERLDN